MLFLPLFNPFIFSFDFSFDFFYFFLLTFICKCCFFHYSLIHSFPSIFPIMFFFFSHLHMPLFPLFNPFIFPPIFPLIFLLTSTCKCVYFLFLIRSFSPAFLTFFLECLHGLLLAIELFAEPIGCVQGVDGLA